jgi:hypothetical protein
MAQPALAISDAVFESLLEDTPILPRLCALLRETAWSESRFASATKKTDYLEPGEVVAAEIERLVVRGLFEAYDEILESLPPERNLQSLIESSDDLAVVVFDACSLREVPKLLDLARRSGFTVKANTYALSAAPADTDRFVQQRMGIPSGTAAALESRLKGRSVYARTLDQPADVAEVPSDQRKVILWSRFPDIFFKPGQAEDGRFFDTILSGIETVWNNTVMRLGYYRDIIVTSDHGYLFLDRGLFWEAGKFHDKPLSREDQKRVAQYLAETFAGDRAIELPLTGLSHGYIPDPRMLKEICPEGPVPNRRLASAVVGRFKWPYRGPTSNVVFRHGGISLMECLVPWLVIRRER